MKQVNNSETTHILVFESMNKYVVDNVSEVSHCRKKKFTKKQKRNARMNTVVLD